jgi:hypothetical protein
MTTPDENSKRTRVEPVFGWLRDNARPDWPERLVRLADGLQVVIQPGPFVRIELEKERRVSPSPARLAWMIRNAHRLTPREGRQWREYQRRVISNPRKQEALDKLDQGESRGLDPRLRLEGATSADCLIECERAIIWIEGKRNDWLDYSTTWDVTRDQLARNTEAAWLYAKTLGKKDFCLILCHEGILKYHEELLLDGYRRGTWSGGWLHLERHERRLLGQRIGTLTWGDIGGEWPPVAALLT